MIPPWGARWLLDFADFFAGCGDEAATTILRLADLRRWPATAVGLAGVGFDATSWLTLREHLETGGIVGVDGTIGQAEARAVAALVEIVCEAVTIAVGRLPKSTSRLVITATASEDLAAVRAALGVPSLYELIERTIRSATSTITLGAPYWNQAALTALTPAIEGALDRGCELHIIVQAGRRPSTGLNQIAAWAASLRAAHGPATIWHFDADDLSDRHIQLHAKFALADDVGGYLGSANLTDQGLEINFEIGAVLGAAEARQLHAVLLELRNAGILTGRKQSPNRPYAPMQSWQQ